MVPPLYLKGDRAWIFRRIYIYIYTLEKAAKRPQGLAVVALLMPSLRQRNDRCCRFHVHIDTDMIILILMLMQGGYDAIVNWYSNRLLRASKLIHLAGSSHGILEMNFYHLRGKLSKNCSLDNLHLSFSSFGCLHKTFSAVYSLHASLKPIQIPTGPSSTSVFESL